ncbi:serine hydrolase domain-containing protein [Nocardioides sp. GXQ0305]|uniref:serine hydrolase domain-containing protein n=1 Tax=Nocardioides sp. GXQ0305 TaxID=3423912 RepID=UPI003D7E4F43
MSEAWARVERELATHTADDRFSGTVLVTRGDETLLEYAGGLAERGNRRPIGPGTRFALASLSKPFTAAAVLTCVGRGELGVHDRVVDVLPPERRPRTLDTAVTVHHLLTHTSGIGDYAEEDEDLAGYVDDYGALWRDLPSYRMERTDHFLPLYADAAPVAAPGAEFHYSNAGYVLLGAVLEEVTGREFVDVVGERVLGPAGMSGAGYFRLDDPVPDLAVGYLPSGRTNVFSTPVVGGGDGGAFATARDLDRFFRSIATGSLLGDELTRLMRTSHAVIEDGWTIGYSLFLSAGAFSHGGGDPGVETGARYLVGQDVVIVVLCNREDGLDPAWDLVEDALAR